MEWRWFCRTPVSCIYCHLFEIDVPGISSSIYFCQLGWGLLLSDFWVPCCWSGRRALCGLLFVGVFPSPSTISSSFISLIQAVNLPSHLKPARGHKSGQDHAKISVSLHKSNSFTILQHKTLKSACLMCSLPDCLREEWGPLGIV